MISEFRGEHRFLSNFYQLKNPIQFDGLVYPTSEHFYQAMKTEDLNRRRIMSMISSSGDVKKYGNDVQLRQDWKQVKQIVMRLGLLLKFSANPEISARLEDTGDEELEEGNTWHDNEWGNCLCPKCRHIVGKNYLGHFLMSVRTVFQLIKWGGVR